jgi:hypothetical protein
MLVNENALAVMKINERTRNTVRGVLLMSRTWR